MKIATILFTYDRPYHTSKTLKALSCNTVVPDKLYIFQDGKKEDTPYQEWKMVGNLINNIKWCDTEVFINKRNIGLALSVVAGVNKAFEENDAVIVLEDDCVSHPLFMKYAIDCLNKYESDKRVFSVNGYSWPVNVNENGTDVYFTGRAGSWGWATWKDRWKLYVKDYMILNDIKRDEYTNHQFLIWGQDLESHLKGNIDGSCNSWAVFWSLQCIKRRGFCPTPYQSLIDNIGNDGSGVHCGNVENMIANTRKWGNLIELVLPDIVEFPPNYEDAYSECFRRVSKEVKLKYYYDMLVIWNNLLRRGVKIRGYFERRNISIIAVWGKGKIFKLLKDELDNDVKIEYIVESNPIADVYEGFPIIRHDAIPQYIQMIVVIPTYDIDRIRKKIINQKLLVGLDEILETLLNEIEVH